MPLSDVSEPWKSFLSEIDAALKERVEFQCIGGFVVTTLFGLPRPTGDVDVLSITPGSKRAYILALAGKGAPLHKNIGCMSSA